MFELDAFLYRIRYMVAGLTFLFILYCGFYVWLVVPFTDFGFHWRPEEQLVILEVPDTSFADALLQPGDVVLEINETPVHRSAVLFRSPVEASYIYTIERDGQLLTVPVPFAGEMTEIGLSYRAPTGFLVLGFWLVGIIMLHYARRDNQTGITVAYVFMGLAVSLTGVQAEILSVTGAWLSRPIWYMSIVGILYLGFVPRAQPLPQPGRILFRTLLVGASVLGLLAFGEALFLFPQHTSIDSLLGVGLYELLLLMGGIAWLVSFCLLVVRAWKMAPSSYERKQLFILLLFIGLAIMPVTLLTLLPRGLSDVVLLPFPLAITLFILVPAGYLFVIFRRGYLGLDIVFSRTAIFLILALVTLGVYSGALTLIRRHVPGSTTSILPETMTFLPVLFLFLYMNKPVDRLIRELFFGEVIRNQSLPQFASALSLKPDLSTLEAIVAQLTKDFQIPQALLVLVQDDGHIAPITVVGLSDLPIKVAVLEALSEPLLRSAAHADKLHPVWATYPWAELLLPIRIRETLTGHLALARPQDGYFNAEQVTFLTRSADIIAVGSEAIFLFDAARRLSLEVMSTRETERKNLSKDIHDRPVQTLNYVVDVLQQMMLTPGTFSPKVSQQIQPQIENLKQVMDDLRDISIGLFPPAIEQGLDMIVSDIILRFEGQFGLKIELDLNVSYFVRYETPLEIGTAVYRVMTEALNNVVKHAQTNQAWLTISQENGYLRVEIADEGVGCNLSSFTLPELIRKRHLGLVGMAECAHWVQGQLTVESRQPRGTAVILHIPMEAEQ
jgi:signal transduction histidine kinase